MCCPVVSCYALSIGKFRPNLPGLNFSERKRILRPYPMDSWLTGELQHKTKYEICVRGSGIGAIAVASPAIVDKGIKSTSHLVHS
jgi:hypothetical protein